MDNKHRDNVVITTSADRTEDSFTTTFVSESRLMSLHELLQPTFITQRIQTDVRGSLLKQEELEAIGKLFDEANNPDRNEELELDFFGSFSVQPDLITHDLSLSLAATTASTCTCSTLNLIDFDIDDDVNKGKEEVSSKSSDVPVGYLLPLDKEKENEKSQEQHEAQQNQQTQRQKNIEIVDNNLKQLEEAQQLQDSDIQDENDETEYEESDYHTSAIKVDLIEAELHYRLSTRTIKADFREEIIGEKSNLSFMFQFHTCNISLLLNEMKNEVRIPMTEVKGFELVDGRIISARISPEFQCSYYYHPTTFQCPNFSRVSKDPTGGLMNGTLSLLLKPCEYESTIKLSIVEMAINKVWYEQHKIKNEPLNLDDVNEKIYITCVTPIAQRILLFPKDGSLRQFISCVQSRLSITPSAIRYRMAGNNDSQNNIVESEHQWIEAKRQALDDNHQFAIPRLRVQLDF
ncbi:10483_t:CDS:2 [Ambispora leptoticha]|uniref:10483_t:CDS:1 n=1 Tax=Ambispora leptoticha TaxID=144679 RepID=A0A9N9A617_9GLOM|nr:10483_t:CDS:2 [Ambispora leptoticha]